MLPNTYLEGYNKTVFYIDFEDVRFIILNSFHFNEINRIGTKQLLWFKEVASRDIKGVVIALIATYHFVVVDVISSGIEVSAISSEV